MTYETDEDKELYEKKRYSFNGSVDVGSIVSFRMWGEAPHNKKAKPTAQ